jgi:hypothetical protein
MDPLSITASAIAVAQAGNRVLGLVSQVRQFCNAPVEMDALRCEIKQMQCLLTTAQSVCYSGTRLPSPEMVSMIVHCTKIVSKLETLLLECVGRRERNGSDRGLAKGKMACLSWMKRKSAVHTLKQQLRDAVSSWTLYLAVVDRYAAILLRILFLTLSVLRCGC